jgi:hypothetical protein
MKGKIFNRQEVQAIIAGNKTMFREVVKPSAGLQSRWACVQDLSKCPTNYLCEVNGRLGAQFQHPLAGTQQSYGEVDKMSPYGWFKCAYKLGQKIFVKESFNIFAGQVAYKQNLANAERYIWKLAQQMKQEHSRLTLQIKEIRVEKLQDINEEDCINEGFDYDWLEGKGNILIAGSITNNFAKNWNATHKKPEEKFGASPWVWSIQFEVVK